MGIVNASGVFRKLYQSRYLVGRKLLFSDKRGHLAAAPVARLGQGVEQRQCNLSLAQIVAGGLSDSVVDGIIVENVVAYLKTQPEQLGIAAQGSERRIVAVNTDSVGPELYACLLYTSPSPRDTR